MGVDIREFLRRRCCDEQVDTPKSRPSFLSDLRQTQATRIRTLRRQERQLDHLSHLLPHGGGR